MRISSSNEALIILDSSLVQHAFIERDILPVVRFWGIPYRILDLAKPALPLPSTDSIGVVVILQEGLRIERLPQAKPIIDGAVARGAGIVNFDHTLDITLDESGSDVRIVSRPPTVKPLLGLRITPSDHFVSGMQHSYLNCRFKRAIPAIVDGSRSGAMSDVLLRGDDDVPVLECSETGVAIANWRISTWLWSNSFFGFTRGFDAFFWRSILWAAKKPFAIAAFPPFGRFRIDDCRGLLRTPDDTIFLDVLEEFGEVTNLGICMESLTADTWSRIAEKARAGKLEVAPHVIRSEEGIFNASGAPRPTLDDISQNLLSQFALHDCPMSKSVSDHSHEITRRGVAIARDLGMMYRMNVMRVDEAWRGVHKQWRPSPFGYMHFGLDRLVDAPGLFTAINHIYSFSDAFLELDQDNFLFSPFGGFTEDRWDFLNGCIKGPKPSDNDVDRAAHRLQRHAEICLTSLFFGGSITHTHFCLYLAPEQWRHVIGSYREYADRFGYLPLGYDKIARYASTRFDLGDVKIVPATSVSTRAESPIAKNSELIWVMTVSGDGKDTHVEWGIQPMRTAP